jgi:hypothetical protein
LTTDRSLPFAKSGWLTETSCLLGEGGMSDWSVNPPDGDDVDMGMVFMKVEKELPQATVCATFDVDVPPQQVPWAADALQQAHADPESGWVKLPQEVVELVKVQVPPSIMTLEEAEEYQRRLTEGRTAVGVYSRARICSITMSTWHFLRNAKLCILGT